MSFGSRVFSIFRNIPDIGIQGADFFLDGIMSATDEEFGFVEGWVNSWEDNILGKPSGTGTGERSIVGATLGPQGFIGATVEAIPESARRKIGSDQWNLLLNGLDFTWSYGVARPIATLATIGNLNGLSLRQSRYLNAILNGEVDPRIASANGWLPFNHRTFNPTTWQNAWNLSQHRSPGQALTLALSNVNIYDKAQLEEFKESNYYYITSGVLDAGLAVGLDPTYIGAKAARLRVLNKRGQNLYDESGGSITNLGPTVEEGIVRPGLFGERPYMEPFIETQRPDARRDSIILRTPSREPIRIGGEKLHNWISENESPALTRLLGGSVTEMLTIPGGRQVGSAGRTRDQLFFERYSYTPKWLDDQPTTLDETLTSYVDEASKIKEVFDDEMQRNLQDGDIPLHVIATGEASVDPKWGVDYFVPIGGVAPETIGTGRWELLSDDVKTLSENIRIETNSFINKLQEQPFAARLLDTRDGPASPFADVQRMGTHLYDAESLRYLPEEILQVLDQYEPFREYLELVENPTVVDIVNVFDNIYESVFGTEGYFNVAISEDFGGIPISARLERVFDDIREIEVDPANRERLDTTVIRNQDFLPKLSQTIISHRELFKSNIDVSIDDVSSQAFEVKRPEITNIWNSLHPNNKRAEINATTLRELIERLDMMFPDFGFNKYFDENYLRGVANEIEGIPATDMRRFGEDRMAAEADSEVWWIQNERASEAAEYLSDKERQLYDVDSIEFDELNGYIEELQGYLDVLVRDQMQSVLEDPYMRSGFDFADPDNPQYDVLRNDFQELRSSLDTFLNDWIRSSIPTDILETRRSYLDASDELKTYIDFDKADAEIELKDAVLDANYQGGRWSGTSGNYTTEKFLDRLSLRLFKDMPTWGPFYKALPKDQLWQRAQIYARVANGAPVDSSSWLPYYNLIRLEKGNPAVKAAMAEQAKDFSYLWSLMRDVDAPVDTPKVIYDSPFGAGRDDIITERAIDEGVREFDSEETFGRAETTVGRNNHLGKVSVHWHFREILHARENITALEKIVAREQRPARPSTDDLLEADFPGISDFNKRNAERLLLTLKAKEAAHALYIKHYLFSPRALQQMAEVQGKRVLEDLMYEITEIGDAVGEPYFDSVDTPPWRWQSLDDVPQEALEEAGYIIEHYENVRFDLETAKELGFTEIQDLFPVPPPARNFVRQDADDILDLGGFTENAPYLELIDRIAQMDKFPWQAVLGLDDALVGMLVKTYDRIPITGWDQDTLLSVVQSKTSPLDDPTPEMLSSTEAHALVADQIMESAMAPLNPALSKALPPAPTTDTGTAAKTLFSKTGPLSGAMNSRFVRLFSERVPHGVININDRSTVANQIDVMFRELGRIDLLVPPGMSKKERVNTLANVEPNSPRRLINGEKFTLLDLAIMGYKGELPPPRDRVEAQKRIDDVQVELLNSFGEDLAVKIDSLNEAALNGAVNAVTPHEIFKEIKWGTPDIAAAMKGILRGDIDAAKRLLEEAAERTERRYTNSDFTEVVIPELGGSTYIRKPISPSQMRQTLVMPRWDKFERLFQVLQGDIKTIIGPNGENLDVSVSARKAIVRATRREVTTMWKRHTLLTPRWQMVVNTDSQLRNIAHLGAAMALGRLGASFDELRVRWLRKAGVDINAVVANGFDEKLDLTSNNWVQRVKEYESLHKQGKEGFELSVEEFVADLIGKEYANKRANIRTGMMTGAGLFFGGPAGAAASAALYTTYTRNNLVKLARRQLADTYGIALRAEALDMVERVNRLDINQFLNAYYPDIDASLIKTDAERYQALSLDERADIYRSWMEDVSTTEAFVYKQLLENEGLLDSSDIADRLNFQLRIELGRLVDPTNPLISFSDIQQTNFWLKSSSLTQKIIEKEWQKLFPDPIEPQDIWADTSLITSQKRLDDFFEEPFITEATVTEILDKDSSLKNLAEELETRIKDRNEAAKLLAARAELVNDYQSKIVGDIRTGQGLVSTSNTAEQLREAVSMLDESAELLHDYGYGSSQVGSTRVDSAFGNSPQQQEIWRRGISANPMARAQLDAEADIQRKYEKFQGSHQYDVLNHYEENNFAKAYNDFLTRHVIPQTIDKTNVAQQMWAEVFRQQKLGSDPENLVKWMRDNEVEKLLPDEWHSFEGLYELAVKLNYEANSILPSSLDVFDNAREQLIRGNQIEWNTDLVPAIRNLVARQDLFWDKYKEQNAKFKAQNRTTIDLDVDEFMASRDWSRWDLTASGNGPTTIEIIKYTWDETIRENPNTPIGVLIARAKDKDMVAQIRKTTVDEGYSGTGVGDFGKVVTDSSFIDATQSKRVIDRYKGFLDGIFENLTMVEDVLSRGTLYESIYTREIFENLQLYRIDQVDGPTYRISPDALKGVVNKTRASALQQTKDVLYDLANRSKFEELVGEISPFFGAWQEVTTRWFGIAAENPVFVFRMLKLWTTVTAQDENGQSVLMVQLPDVFDKEIDVPFFGDTKLFGAISIASKMPIDLNLRSASLVGGFAGTGPIVTFLVGEAVMEVPELYDALDFLFPYGLAEGGNALERLGASYIPSWPKSFAAVAGLETDRRTATAIRVMQDILAENYINGTQLPNTEEAGKELMDEVARRTKYIYMMRMLRSVAVPVSYQQQSPYWPILEEFWRVEKEYGNEVADYWLLENHPELWSATARRTLADGVISGSIEGQRYYEEHKAMATEYPELGPFITGENGAMDIQFAYNRAVAQIERQEGRRGTLEPENFLHEAGANSGWREYRVFRNSLTNELNKRMRAGGSGSLNAQSNFDLWKDRRNFVTALSQKNPMWGEEFNKIGNPITQRKILQGFRLIVADEAFAYRPEIPLIQRYLELHDGIAQQLLQRAERTNNRSYLRLSFSQNQDLARQWEIGVLQLLTFPDFGNVYDRYFSNIESVNTSNLSAYAPATLRTGN